MNEGGTNSRFVENWLDSYLEWTDQSEPSRLYRKWVGLICLSSALQRKVWLPWDKDLFTNLFVILVGPSGARKGTAINPGRTLLERTPGVTLAADDPTMQYLMMELKECVSTDVDPATGLMEFHSSMTIISDELAVMTGYEQRELLISLTDWYDCKRVWTYGTRSHGKETIENLWVSLLGATTPEQITDIMPKSAIGGGLTSRIIFVYSPWKEKTIVVPGRLDAKLENYLLYDLEQISLLKGPCQITKEFAEAYSDWYLEQDRLRGSLAAPQRIFSDPMFERYLDRRQTHLLKLAILHQVARSDRLVLGVQAFNEAKETLEEVEEVMPQAFTMYGEGDKNEVMQRVMKTIAYKGEVSFADVLSLHYRDISKKQLVEILSTLHAMEFCKITDTAGGATIKYIEGGKPVDHATISPDSGSQA